MDPLRPPSIPERTIEAPTRRPSILSRLGMTGLTIVPALVAVGCLSYAIPQSNEVLIIAGGSLAVVIIGLIVLAQGSPGSRQAAIITMGVLSAIFLIVAGVAVLIVAILFAMCSKAMGAA